jgi:hypothetical protein
VDLGHKGRLYKTDITTEDCLDRLTAIGSWVGKENYSVEKKGLQIVTEVTVFIGDP